MAMKGLALDLLGQDDSICQGDLLACSWQPPLEPQKVMLVLCGGFAGIC